MNVQLDTREVQEAVTEYLRAHNVVVEDPRQVDLEIVDATGARINIANCTPVVVARGVKLPSEPYR